MKLINGLKNCAKKLYNCFKNLSIKIWYFVLNRITPINKLRLKIFVSNNIFKVILNFIYNFYEINYEIILRKFMKHFAKR